MVNRALLRVGVCSLLWVLVSSGWADAPAAAAAGAKAGAGVDTLDEAACAPAPDSWCGREIARALKALKAIETRAGADAPETVPERLRLGECYRAAGCNRAAEEQFTRALAIRREGLQHLQNNLREVMQGVVAAHYALGAHYRAVQAFDLAEAQFRAGRDQGSRLLGPDDPDTIRAAAGLASVLAVRGDLEQARKLTAWATENVAKVCGPKDLELARVDDILGTALLRESQPKAAEPVFTDMVTVSRASLPADHPDVADALNRLASVSYELGKRDTTVALLEEALAIRTRALGPKHPLVERSRRNLSEARAVR